MVNLIVGTTLLLMCFLLLYYRERWLLEGRNLYKLHKGASSIPGISKEGAIIFEQIVKKNRPFAIAYMLLTILAVFFCYSGIILVCLYLP